MKAFFNAHGDLVVQGTDATEWFALRTWADNHVKSKSPLWVVTSELDTDPDSGLQHLVEHSRQLQNNQMTDAKRSVY